MSTLWMGDLEAYMDDRFVRTAFAAAGHPAQSAKVIMNKLTGVSAGYCFVEFPTPQSAQGALNVLNGIVMPGSSPPKRFKLNWATYGKDNNQLPAPEFSIFVGDLTEEVTDSMLFDFFRQKFPSTKGAKVVIDTSGVSRGYGFVRFGNEAEHLRSLAEMHGIRGCGGKALRVSIATPKKPTTTTSTSPTTSQLTTSVQYLQQYQQYQQYLAAWQASYQQQANQYYTNYAAAAAAANTSFSNADITEYQQDSEIPLETDETSLVEAVTEHIEEQTTVDPNEIRGLTAEIKLLVENEKNLYYELEDSRWRPVLSLTEGPTALVA